MKDDLKRLMNEFLEETRELRRVKVDLQLTNNAPPKFEDEIREVTLSDFIEWLNEVVEETK